MSQPANNSNLNQSSHRSGKNESSVDVTQWRHDVNSFAVAIRQMLDSIHAELSNGLTSGKARVEVMPNQDRISAPSNVPDSIVPEHSTTTPTHSSQNVESECDQLLAKLKEQLSQQLTQ